jgi:uncharacterized glyoxalase superfamily protein PhnB
MITKPIIPILRIFEETKAKEFYIDFLGFNIDFEHRFQDDFPLYMQISLGQWVLHLSEQHGDCCPGASLMVEMEGIESYQQILISKAYKHAKPGLEDTEWNTLEMTISDPFGNRLTFFENK